MDAHLGMECCGSGDVEGRHGGLGRFGGEGEDWCEESE